MPGIVAKPAKITQIGQPTAVAPPRRALDYAPTQEFLKYDWAELTRAFPASSPSPGEGTRFVVQVPTLHQGRHASPAAIGQRIIDAMGGDAEKANRLVRLSVGVNRREHVNDGPGAIKDVLSELQGRPDSKLPVPGVVSYISWRPRWSGPEADPVKGASLDTLRFDAAREPGAMETLRSREDDACAQAPIGMLRTLIAKSSLPWQRQRQNERVLTLISDADTVFPHGFFDRLAALPAEVRWASGGYTYDAHATPTMHVQNLLDMHVRSDPGIDKRLVYHPEPCLVVDTSALRDRLRFGDGGLESRALMHHVQNETGPLTADSVVFCPTLRVTTNAERFVQSAGEDARFDEALSALANHAQSHARPYVWMRQLAAGLGTQPQAVGAMVSLLSVPGAISAGLTNLQDMPAYLDYASAQLTAPADRAHPALAALTPEAAAGTLAEPNSRNWAVAQTRAWAASQVDFIQGHVLDRAHPWEESSGEAALCRGLKRKYEELPASTEPDPAKRVRRAFRARVAAVTEQRAAAAPGGSQPNLGVKDASGLRTGALVRALAPTPAFSLPASPEQPEAESGALAETSTPAAMASADPAGPSSPDSHSDPLDPAWTPLAPDLPREATPPREASPEPVDDVSVALLLEVAERQADQPGWQLPRQPRGSSGAASRQTAMQELRAARERRAAKAAARLNPLAR